ncbi:MAG: hypothetical protein FWG64_14070 [Firmicutes bacterium]|nr:hypothetical protein [Bacillota bacterium]
MATYFELYFQCPVCIALGNTNIPTSYWEHSSDGGIIEVGDDANYRCKSCNQKAHVSKWQYGCPGHSGDNGELVYKAASPQSMVKAFGIAAQMSDQYSSQWLKNFINNLGEW